MRTFAYYHRLLKAALCSSAVKSIMASMSCCFWYLESIKFTGVLLWVPSEDVYCEGVLRLIACPGVFAPLFFFTCDSLNYSFLLCLVTLSRLIFIRPMMFRSFRIRIHVSIASKRSFFSIAYIHIIISENLTEPRQLNSPTVHFPLTKISSDSWKPQSSAVRSLPLFPPSPRHL